MATITKNAAGDWKAVVRRRGWRTVSKTFRRKHEAVAWARSVEDEIMRKIYIEGRFLQDKRSQL